jgi:hypothetical protein
MANSPIKLDGLDLQSLSYMMIEMLKKISDVEKSEPHNAESVVKMANLARSALEKSGNSHIV